MPNNKVKIKSREEREERKWVGVGRTRVNEAKRCGLLYPRISGRSSVRF